MQQYISEHLAGTAAETTLNKRIRFLVELSELIPGHKDFSFLDNTKEVKDRINRSDNVNTQWVSLWHVLQAIQSDPIVVSADAKKFYKELADEIKVKRVAKNDNNIATEKQATALQNALPHYQEELHKIIYNLFSSNGFEYAPLKVAEIKALKSSFINELQDLAILALFLYQPALRNDWADLHLTSKKTGLDPKKNYLYIKGNLMQLIMHTYKTDKHMGEQVITIRPELVKLLKIWLPIVQQKTGDKLAKPFMYTINSKQFDRIVNEDAMRRKIPRISGRVLRIDLSINDYRVLWETAIQSDPVYQSLTVAEKKKLHHELLHGIDVSKYYKKI